MSAQVTITQLPVAGAITGTESVPIVQNGVTVQTTTGAIAASPAQTQTFLTVNQEPSLPNSRRLGATNGLTLTDGGAQGVLNVTTTGALLSLVGSGTGLQVKTSSTALTSRSIVVGSNGISVTNGDGISGDPTLSLTGQVLGFANASVNGLVTLSTGGTVSSAQIVGTSSQIVVTNGNGISGSPTISISDNVVLPGTGSATLPLGTTGQQPGGSQGQIRFNTDTQTFDGYSSGSWRQFSTAGGVTTFSGGTTGLLPSSAQSGAITLSGTLIPANGGTGASTLTGYLVGNGSSAFTAVATIPNAGLTNSSISINGSSVSLGGSITVTATATNPLTISTGLTGTSYNGSTAVTIAIDSTVATLAGAQTLTNKTISGSSNTLSNIANASLSNSSLTLGSTSVSLGATASALAGLASVAVTADPTTAFQLTTKQYVDGLVSSGLVYHQPVQAATTASLASTTGGTVTYNNGASGVGATITLSVALTVLDGYTLLNTNRILVKDEVNQAYNGIYTWATGGTVLTRATDADTYGVDTNQLSLNDYFFVQNGTVNKGTSYVVTTTGTITFGTTAITFAEFSSSQVYTGTSPINISGTVISLNTVPATSGGTGTATVATGDLLYGSATNTWSKLTATTNGYILTLASGVPTWSSAPATGVTTFSAGTTGLTPNTATSGAVTLAGTLAVANGGTGRAVGNYSVYANEIHVGKDGNDTTGDGTLINPVLTITKALTLVGAGRNTVIVHPGSYSESPTVSSANTTIATTELTGANTQISGTLTLSAAARISGLKITNLTITGSGNTYISNCTVDTQVVKSGSNYVEIINSELQCTAGVQITGAGTVSIIGNKCWAVAVSNASANVLIKDCFQVLTPSVTAGTLQLDGSAIFAASPASNAVTSSAGSFITLANCFVLNSAGNNVERVSLAGFYSILNLVYDKTNSTFAGTNLNAIDYFSVINADTLVLTNDLAIAYGGTNSSATPTAGGSAYGTGTAYAFTAAGTAGQVLLSNGSSAPTWSGVSGGTF
jgi:hypothetical protein